MRSAQTDNTEHVRQPRAGLAGARLDGERAGVGERRSRGRWMRSAHTNNQEHVRQPRVGLAGARLDGERAGVGRAQVLREVDAQRAQRVHLAQRRQHDQRHARRGGRRRPRSPAFCQARCSVTRLSARNKHAHKLAMHIRLVAVCDGGTLLRNAWL